MPHRKTLEVGAKVCISNDEYIISRLIARGGTSLIYEAIRPYCDSEFDLNLDESNAKRVILKELAPFDIPFERDEEGAVLFPAIYIQELKDLFRNEIINISYIQSNNRFSNRIPDMDAYGEDKGTVYIAMNHIRGETLGRYLNKNELTEEQMVQLFLNILLTIQTLHNMPSPHYHLDLKPSNFIVGEQGITYLFDFGSVLITNGRWIKNYTECYSAPEVIFNHMTKLGGWSDIYSLGAIFYEMITNQVPDFDKILLSDGYYYEKKATSKYDFNELLHKMLNQNIHQRVKRVEEIIEHIEGLMVG